MRNPKSLWPLFALALAAGLLGLGAEDCPPTEPVITAGTDCWQTDPDGTVWRPKSAITPGFFGDVDGTQSNTIPPPQFPANFQLMGKPLTPDEVRDCGCPEHVETVVTWLDPHGKPTDDIRHKVGEVVEEITVVDTCVHREQNATFKGKGAAVKVDIELRQLSLVSVNPLTVTYGHQPGAPTKMFRAIVTESATQNKGTLTFTAKTIASSKANGDMALGSLPIHFDVVFEEVDAAGAPVPGGFTTAPISGSVDFKDTKGKFKQ